MRNLLWATTTWLMAIVPMGLACAVLALIIRALTEGSL